MQKNPGAKTIEGDLEEALYLAGAVPDHDRGCPKRYDWARSARTDKGVSAVGQVVSGRFYIDPPGLIDRLHQNLSPQFRIFGYKRVTASFNAKKFCDRRRYVYLIPVFALDPCSHRDRESVLASLGSGNELVKCRECSERGRKIVGVMGKRGYEFAGVESGISSNSKAAADDNGSNLETNLDCSKDLTSGSAVDYNILSNNCEIKEGTANDHSSNLESNKDLNAGSDILSNNGTAVLQVEEDTALFTGDGCDVSNSSSVSVTEREKVDSELDARGSNEDEIEGGKGNGFCYGNKERERFNRILKLYEGTHNFHNFTTRTKAEDPAARRFIISFQANTTVTVDGIEFVKCEVVGQSFMLHQIRKMIGVAVAIMRDCAPESLIETALKQDIRITVPTAPEVGLYLDECFFTSYNQKWKDTHEEVSMKAYEEEAEEFKMRHIYSHIASMEHKEGAVALWLHSLNYRNYPDLRGVINGSTDEMKGAEVE